MQPSSTPPSKVAMEHALKSNGSPVDILAQRRRAGGERDADRAGRLRLGRADMPRADRGGATLAGRGKMIAAALTREGALVSVAGGGDTVAALAHAGVAQDFSYISTAGGAFLEWMEGKELPGVVALQHL